MIYTVSKLLEIARAELGYKEKETNSQLDDKTANAGDGNWTKYARDLHSAGYYQAAKNGYAWCDMFVDWCFLQLCNGDAKKAQDIICQTGLYGAGCSWSAKYYKQQGRFYTSNPKPGDQIFFGTSIEDAEHTGIVEEVTATTVITIEGNTSNKVARRTYQLNYNKLVGYGRPKFDAEEVVEVPAVTGTPSTGSAADEKKIWDYFMDKLGNAYGVAGLMGNLNAESALRSNNLQQTYEQKLGYTDATYTSAVDDGSYGGFVKDCAGYGLAQWTYYTRKQKLLDYAKNKKKSIGDFDMQLDFLYKELSESYKAVWNDLKTADSILVASNSVLLKFERPANQSESVQKKRAEYGQKYYDKYADKEATTTPVVPTTPESLKFKKGDIVKFAGGKHYSSASAMNGVVVKASKAKITNVYATGKHPYHCRAVNDAGTYIGGVYGWVDANTLSEIEVETKPVVSAGIKKGDVVSIAKDAKYYGGVKDIPDWVIAKQWIVTGVSGSRVVVDKSVDGKNSINSPIDAKYLTVVGADEPWTPKEGDIVIYNGDKHYANANAANGSTCKGGKAKITDIYQLGKSKHPYHLVRVAGSGATVYGWVDAGSFTKAA